MSWVRENCLSFFQMFCIKVVKTGRIPKHIAFIMDGNRRYAKKNSVDNSAGHYKGFDKLSETLRWCLDLGIPEVTVYAFSIENFKRSKEEVDGLMDLARDKFRRLMDEIEQINEWGVRIHIAGRLSLLPKDLQALVSKSMLATRDNNKLRLNIAYAYTGRDEISRAASHIVDGVKNNDLAPQDIDDELVSQTLELREAELLVSNTVLYFTEVLWPEFSIWNLLAAIIHFQRYAPPPKEPEHISDTKKQFLAKLESQRWQHIEKIINCPLYA